MRDYEPNPYLQASYACCVVAARCYAPDLTASVPKMPQAVRPLLYAVAGLAALAHELTTPWQPVTQGGRALNELRMQAMAAQRWHFSSNPLLHAWQQTVRVCHLKGALIDHFFEALAQAPGPAWAHAEPPLAGRETPQFSAAEVVALLVLGVLCAERPATWQALQEPARYLGAALDKLAWLQGPVLGSLRTHVPYYPTWNVNELTAAGREHVLHDIEHGLAVAKAALPLLPERMQLGVGQLLRQQEAQVRRLRQPRVVPAREASAGWLAGLAADLRQFWNWAFGW